MKFPIPYIVYVDYKICILIHTIQIFWRIQMKNLTYVLLIAASFVTTSASAMEMMGTIKIVGDVNQSTKVDGKISNIAKENAIATQAISSVVVTGSLDMEGNLNQSTDAGSIINVAGSKAIATQAVSSLVGGSAEIKNGRN